MNKNEFPPGWDEKRVRGVLEHYENQSEEQAVAKDEAAVEGASQTLMPLRVYEVVSGGTKVHYPPGGEDWSVLVAAHSAEQARDIAYAETEIGRPWAIYEWGIDTRESAEPGILRGPFKHYPAVNRGWKMYQEDPASDSATPPVIEWPVDG